MILRSENLQINLKSDEIRLERFEVSGCEINNQLTSSHSYLGKRPYAINLDSRRVKIEGYICENLESNRRSLAKICIQESPFYVIDGDYRLEVVARKSPEYSSERRFSQKTLKFCLDLVAINPLWLACEKKSSNFPTVGGVSNDERAIYITVESDTSVGFEAEMQMRTSAERILLRKGTEYIDLRGLTLEIGDVVYISTLHGKKEVRVTKKSTGAIEDLMGYVATGSAFFDLDVGENRLDYTITSGILNATFSYTPAYMR